MPLVAETLRWCDARSSWACTSLSCCHRIALMNCWCLFPSEVPSSGTYKYFDSLQAYRRRATEHRKVPVMYRRTANYCSSWTQLLGVGSVIYFGVSRYCYDNKSATMISGPTVCVFTVAACWLGCLSSTTAEAVAVSDPWKTHALH